MKKITQEQFDKLPIKYGIKQCPAFTDYSDIKNFGKRCSFGIGCNLYQVNFGELSDKLTTYY